jgi:nucleoid DNA-binding protein
MTKSELIEIIATSSTCRPMTSSSRQADAGDHERRARDRRAHRDPRLRQLLAALPPPRQGRNPKTGEAVALSGKYVPHFKPGKDLRELAGVNSASVFPSAGCFDPADTAFVSPG